jgi:hypothetical protein
MEGSLPHKNYKLILMKRLLTLILMLLIIFTLSCKKDKQSKPEVLIIGNWELREVIGGQIPGVPGMFAPGNGNILRFSGKNYTYAKNGAILDSGTYTIGFKFTGKVKENTLIYNGDGFERFFRIDNNKLTIYTGIIPADGTIQIYERVQENTPTLH